MLIRSVTHTQRLYMKYFYKSDMQAPPSIRMCESNEPQKFTGLFYLVTPNYPNYNTRDDYPIGCKCEMSVPVGAGNIMIESEDIQLQNKRFDKCDSEYLMTSKEILIQNGEFSHDKRHCGKKYTVVSTGSGLVHAYAYEPEEVGKRGTGAKVLVQSIPLQCTHGWTLQFNLCYRLMTSQKEVTIAEARGRCQKDGDFLTIIKSAAEDEYFRRFLNNNDVMLLDVHRSGKRWYWSDGSDVYFQNFDNTVTDDNKKCAVISGPNGFWTATKCDHVYPKDTKYVCMTNTTGLDSTQNRPSLKMTCSNMTNPVYSKTTTTPTQTTNKREITTPVSTGITIDVIGKPVPPPKANVGLIVGVSLVSVALIAILIVAFIIYRRRKRPSPFVTQEHPTGGGSLTFVPSKGLRDSLRSNGTDYQTPDNDDEYAYIAPSDLDGYAVGGYVNAGSMVSDKTKEKQRDIESGYISPMTGYDSASKGPEVDFSNFPIAPKPPGYNPKNNELTVNIPRDNNYNTYMDTLPHNVDRMDPYTGLRRPEYDHLSQAYSDRSTDSYVDPAPDYPQEPSFSPGSYQDTGSNENTGSSNNTGSTGIEHDIGDDFPPPPPEDYFDNIPPPIPSAPHPTLPHGMNDPVGQTLPQNMGNVDLNHDYYNGSTISNT